MQCLQPLGVSALGVGQRRSKGRMHPHRKIQYVDSDHPTGFRIVAHPYLIRRLFCRGRLWYSSKGEGENVGLVIVLHGNQRGTLSVLGHNSAPWAYTARLK